MIITRANISIELTADELHRAYMEEQQSMRESAFQGELEAQNISYQHDKLYHKAFSLYNALLEKEEGHEDAFSQAVEVLKGGNTYEII